MAQTTYPNLLGQLARAYVAQSIGINPSSWPLTHDEAWISFAARLLRRRKIGKREVATSK